MFRLLLFHKPLFNETNRRGIRNNSEQATLSTNVPGHVTIVNKYTGPLDVK